jgi:hypothetical protein
MEARYHLLPRGVFDRWQGCVVLPREEGWDEYLAHVALGNLPDPQLPPVVQIEKQRRDLAARVNALRNKAMVAGVMFEGNLYQSDERSRARIAQRLALGTFPDGFTWRSADNLDVPMDAATFRRFALAMQAHADAFNVRAWALKDEIAAADDPSAIDIETYERAIAR